MKVNLPGWYISGFSPLLSIPLSIFFMASVMKKLLFCIFKGGVNWWEINTADRRIPWLLSKFNKQHRPSYDKQRARFAEAGVLVPVFERSTTETKIYLLRYENVVNISPLKFRTLNTINHLPKLTAFATKCNIDIICMQEKWYYHSELDLKYHETGNEWTFVSTSALRHSVYVTIGDIRMLHSPRALKSINSKEKIHMRIMCNTCLNFWDKAW